MRGVPTVKEAEKILMEAWEQNKTPWKEHSEFVGEAARAIARECDDLDEDVAYALGLMHDIGRYEGFFKMRHSFVGYRYLLDKGYERAARICMTHSFPYKNCDAVFGKWDCTDEEYDFVREYLDNVEYDDYDKLIQMCDCLATAEGIVLMEKRMVQVALAHGTNEYTQRKWKAFMDIKEYFEGKIGKSIYKLFPDIVENSFK